MRIGLTMATMAALLVLASGPAAWGQYSRGSSNTYVGGMRPLGSSSLGGLGTSGLGSGFGSSNTFGLGSFGTSSMFGLGGGFGSSGFGTSGFGTSGFGTSGFGTSSGFGGRQGSIGSSGLFGTSSMFGTTTQQSGGFVGVDTQDVRSVMQAMGADQSSSQGSQRTRTGTAQPGMTQRSTQGYSAQNRALRTPSGARQGASGRSGYGSTQVQVRTAVRVGFDYSPTGPTQLGSTLATRLENCPRLQLRAPVDVSVEGKTAVLRGVVATEHDRVIAEQLARLEPGIWQVRNELTVAPPAAPEEEPENR